MRYILVLSILMLSVSGCMFTKVHTMPVQTFGSSYDKVWDSTINYLNKQKEPIVVADKEKGIIQTDWVNLHKLFAVKRYRYVIELKKTVDEKIQVGVASPQEEYSMGDWEEMLPSERRAKRIFRYIKSGAKTSIVQVRQGVNISKGVEKRPFSKTRRGLVK